MTHLRRRPKELVVQERRIYHAELDQCPECGHPLHLSGHYRWRKTIQHLDGVVYVASQSKECRTEGCSVFGKQVPSGCAQTEALPHSTYGLDVVAQIGWWRDREHLGGAEIYDRLCPQVQIGRRHVDLLTHAYRLLLACAQRPSPAQLSGVVAEYGGVLLSLDGLQPEGAQEQLWVVREVLSDTILAAGWLPRVTQETLGALLRPVKVFLEDHGWPILSTLSDKQVPLEKALNVTWPHVPHQWCQIHYLRNAASPLYERDRALRTDLRGEVRKQIRASLREVADGGSDVGSGSALGGAFSP